MHVLSNPRKSKNLLLTGIVRKFNILIRKKGICSHENLI